jgi:hypothetical protein
MLINALCFILVILVGALVGFLIHWALLIVITLWLFWLVRKFMSAQVIGTRSTFVTRLLWSFFFVVPVLSMWMTVLIKKCV